jgi:hypothetical protein
MLTTLFAGVDKSSRSEIGPSHDPNNHHYRAG